MIAGMNFGTHIDNAIRFVKPSLGTGAAYPRAHRHVGDAVPD